MNSARVLLTFFLLCSMSTLNGQMSIPGALSSHVSSHMDYSSDMRDSFAQVDNTGNVNNPLSVPHKEFKTQLHISVETLEDGGRRLIFTFPAPVTFTKECDQRGLYLKFNQTVDSPDLLEAQQELSHLIKSFSNGFNTLYLVSKKPLYFITEASEQTFTLEILPDTGAPLELTRTLQVAQARLLIEQRRYFAAVVALEQLDEEYPDDKDVLLLYAALYGLFPLWQDQVELLATLREEYPADENIWNLFYDAYTPHTPYIQYERQVQRTIGLAAVQLYGVRGEEFVSCDCNSVTYWGAQDQVWSGHIGQVINNEGVPQGFVGARLRGQLWLRKEWDNGTRFGGTIYGQSHLLGCSLEGARLVPWLQGNVAFIAAWHRPYWAVFETLVYRGREDLVQCEISSVYNRWINWGATIGTHRVGITGTPNGFSSVLLGGEFFYNIIVGNPTIAFNYGLDAEYITAQKVKIGLNGPYNPVPYTSFENHSLRLYYIYQWRDWWNLTLFAGETINRLGGLHDYTLGASIRYSKPTPCAWDFELSAYRFPSTVVQGATAEYFTATVTFRF